MRDAARERERLDCLPVSAPHHGVAEGQRTEDKVGGVALIEGALRIAGEVPHHGHVRAAEDQHDIVLRQEVVPEGLEPVEDAVVRHQHVLELVDDDDLPAGTEGEIHRERRLPVRELGRREAKLPADRHRECRQQHLPAGFVDLVVQVLLSLQELHDERALAHPAPA